MMLVDWKWLKGLLVNNFIGSLISLLLGTAGGWLLNDLFHSRIVRVLGGTPHGRQTMIQTEWFFVWNATIDGQLTRQRCILIMV
jgi:hypothetical protein